MVIISGLILMLLSIVILAAFVGLFFKRFRKRAALLLVASFVGMMIVGVVGLGRQNGAFDIGTILALIPVIIFVAFVGLFFRRFRKKAALLLVASLVGGMIVQGVELERQNEVARQAGFRDHQDFVAAQEAGVTSAEEWEASRGEREEAARLEEARKAEQARLAKECDDRRSVTAFVMSQEVVKANLRAPSSADFPTINAVNVSPIGDCRYVVNAFVDAQNGFGA